MPTESTQAFDNCTEGIDCAPGLDDESRMFKALLSLAWETLTEEGRAAMVAHSSFKEIAEEAARYHEATMAEEESD